MAERGTDAVIRPVQVRGDDVVESVTAAAVLTVGPADPAGGDDCVDRTEHLRRARERTVDARALADVAPLDVCRAVDPGRGLAQTRVVLASSVTAPPSRAMRRAIARPMPVPAPGTTTSLPVIVPHSSAICDLSVVRSPCARRPPSVDCRCAEHGTRLGRSSPGRPYAEAEGQPGKWTKAHPARRIRGPFQDRA